MSSFRKTIYTICNLGSKILTRSCRNPEHHLKQQCVSVNSPSTTIIWRRVSYGVSRKRFYHSYHHHAHQNLITLSPKKILITVLVSGGVVITVWRLERIPYSKRFHLILISTDLERRLGELCFKDDLKIYEGKILPETHPVSVRVKSISKDIIEALQTGLGYEKVGSGLGYNNEEVQDDDMRRVKKCRKNGFKVATYHLEGLNWEIVVVDEPIVSASCIAGGKVVVFTGLLNHFRSDAEIATVIAHEVGHLVARHGAEKLSKIIWLIILEVVLNIGDEMSKRITEAYKYLLLPSRQRNEMEAAYIGLLLLASAGYDPRVAPQVYEKLGEISGLSPLDEHLSTHPYGKKRAKALFRAKVMEEALTIYRESRSGILLDMLGVWVI
ncbi:hypothetical protein MKW98_011429 [Papaver atlanticum]|uniref:Peptidase M48 domain-containing protein n=1 Tax=Papaver atlanticum TaxID=357466 RepID=A0AAD4SJQ7_9MAGN|nr:hypothetical protein MKW98_011429 [Papaver atlanticum]